MIDVLQSNFFLHLSEKRAETVKCEDMNNALEDGCSQMKGHSWLIFFPSHFFFEMAKERKKEKRLIFSL